MQDKTTSEVAAAAAATTVDEGNAPAVQDFAATAAATAAVAAGCQIYPPTSFQVCGAIRDKYNQMGGPTSFLLFPKSNELTNPGNTGKRSEFIGGNIYWSAATGAHPVAHEFLFKWGDHGYETGFLKYPKTDEIVLSDGISRRQQFQGGHIYWSPATGAHSIQGAIYDKWTALGAETGVLKFPTSDEVVAPDGTGRFTTFQGGAIYWHPTTGAHPVYGPLHMFWGLSGYEAGPYGYPTGDPVYTGDNVSQTFQRGTIQLWDGQLGGVHQVDESDELTLDDTWIFPEYPAWPPTPDTFADWNTVDDPDGSLAEQNRQEAVMVDNALATLGGYEVTRYLWKHMYEDPGIAVTLAPSTIDEWMEESFTGIDGFTAPALVRSANRDRTVATAIEYADRLNKPFKATFIAIDKDDEGVERKRWILTRGLSGSDQWYAAGRYSMSACTSVIARPGPAGQHPIKLVQQAHTYDVYDFDPEYTNSLPVDFATEIALRGFRLGINKWFQVFGHGSQIAWEGLR
ncbi:hypothetical protein VX037_23380 [Gordonia sp. Z-3]|jgi:hypothetical protein|uniref:LGFP repeat-containing protein n=1 Tax=unclassified Gordonia (in: high G+C Gram-positive bacteria) TaxID=2657482 RepID=UPI000C3F026B|nr:MULTISPECIES: hypothetical protein [unclassified Gordonia (in: high G+C Gram-positive bacteria)]MAU80688.1 hypothetical protein [Gordonia sp. (in: high G+C Gram-positive bacteria)]MED5803972.1 hypothetical protein [Gordonia sp. Z-3]